LIRHAQSHFNKGFFDYLDHHQMDLTWEEAILNDHFNQEVSYNSKYIDCKITEEGKYQVKLFTNLVQNCSKNAKRLAHRFNISISSTKSS
jgi:hypothetical protein